MTYALHLAVYFGIYAIAALSLNLIVGYCGRLTMAHAAYFAIGSYAYALASMNGWNFLGGLAAALIVGGIGSLAVSLPAWRFRGDFFVLVSLAMQVLTLSLITNWFDPSEPAGTFRNLTNGPFGLTGVPRPSVFGFEATQLSSMAAVSLGLAAAVFAGLTVLVRSPWGRLLLVTRDDELAARSLGKNVRLAQVQAFGLACALAAVAGALYGSYVSYIDPSSAAVSQSVTLLTMVIVGGVGNEIGPIAGALLLLLLPEALRTLALPAPVAANVANMLFGLLLIVLMCVRPRGLAGHDGVR